MTDPDEQEDIWDFHRRFFEGWHGSDKETDGWSVWWEFGLPAYKEQEEKRLLRLKEREKEAKMLEREQARREREAERIEEREAERERRDPTPDFKPATFEVRIPYDIRSKHIYVPGSTQRGKSTQMHNIIYHDIMEGNGVAVLDPKRDLLSALVHSLPATRMVDGIERKIIDDIIFLDLETPVPLNFLDRNPRETERVINDLVYVVTKGDETLKAAEPLLEKIIRTFLLIPDTTITDMYRFIAMRDEREKILAKLKLIAPEFAKIWDPFPKEGVATLERRLGAFYLNPSLKAIFDARTPPLNFADLMDNKKILLVNLSPPGDKNSSLYGSLIMIQIMSTINKRTKIPKYKRVPFFLHVDEFELFQTDSFAHLLSVAGGLGLRLTLGNQYLGQVSEKNLDAILGNNPTYIFFQMSQKDAAKFEAVIAPYKPDRLTQLDPYQACFKIVSKPPVFKWTKLNFTMTEQDQDDAELMLDKLREITIARYRTQIAAQSGTIRTGDNAPLLSRQVLQDEVNDRPSEEITPSGPATISLDDGKKKRP
jgi:hypothetical protein